MDDYERYKLAQKSRIMLYKMNMEQAYKHAYDSKEEDPEVRVAYENLYFHWKKKIKKLEDETY